MIPRIKTTNTTGITNFFHMLLYSQQALSDLLKYNQSIFSVTIILDCIPHIMEDETFIQLFCTHIDLNSF